MSRRPLQITTFNVNGIRSIRDYYAQSKLNGNLNFSQFLDYFQSDILCFQEHKTNESGKLSQELSFPLGYLAFYVFPKVPRKIGYSGVVTFVRESSPWRPIAWFDGFSGVNDGKLSISPLLQSHFSRVELVELDSEARCIITDHFHFFLINCYFPNDSGEHRNQFRNSFYYAIQLRCLDLIREHGKAVIVIGDINIAYHPLDHCEYATAFKKEFPDDFDVGKQLISSDDSKLITQFYTNPMRRWLAEWLYLRKCPDVEFEIEDHLLWRDCFRAMKPFKEFHDQYTCWNTLVSARGSNYGTRIDAIFTSGPLFAEESLVQLAECDILPKVMGSDHCPVYCKLEFDEAMLEVNDEELQRLQLKKGNIARSFGRLDEFFSKKRKNDETVEAAECSVIVEEKIVKKTTILDFFEKKPKMTVQGEDEKSLPDIDETLLTTAVDADSIQTPQNQNKEEWNSFFTKPVAPHCHHGMEAIMMRVKKPGPNRGRSFYCCSKPVGPSGHPESRCEFFQWLNPSK